MVVVPTGSMAYCVSYFNKESLLEELKNQVGTESQVYVFVGQRHLFTQGEQPFLFDLDTAIPLFDPPTADRAALAEDGYMGERFLEPSEAYEEDDFDEDGDSEDTEGGEGFEVDMEEFEEDEEEEDT